MPKSVAQIKCLDCQDEFTVTSDDITYCKCGKCGVKAQKYGVSYQRGSNFNVLENKIYYTDDDFIILDDDTLDLWNTIKDLKGDFKYPLMAYNYESVRESADGKKFLNHIVFELRTWDHGESNEIKIRVDLEKEYTREALESINKRMNFFYKLLLRAKDGKLNINNRKMMQRISKDWSKEQQELYDYTFYF